VSAVGVFGEQLDGLGIWWPRGDGDAVRMVATAWEEMATFLDELLVVLDATSAMIATHYQGEAAGRYSALWAKWSGDHGYLAVTAADCRRLAASLNDFSTDIDTADRTLAMLVNEAFTAIASALTPEIAQAWLDWLHQGASSVSNDLGDRADVRATPLRDITTWTPSSATAPDRTAPDRSTIDPARISWPDPGRPGDLSAIATTPVDFGAGQGRLPWTMNPTQPLPAYPGGPDEYVGRPVPPDGVEPGAQPDVDPCLANPTVPTDTEPVAPLPPTMPPPIACVPPPGVPLPGVSPTDLTALPTVDEELVDATLEEPTDDSLLDEVVPELVADDLDPTELDEVVDPLAGAMGGAGGGFGGGGGFDLGSLGGGGSISVPPLPDMPTFEPTGLSALTPIEVQPPSLDGSDTMAMAAGAAGVTGLAAKAASGTSGKAPFFPMMPMAGGGATGDERPEPRRRSRYRLPRSS
jgi:hypothetical protein